MSKSYNNTIEIFAEGNALKKVIMGIVTDSTPVESPKDPDSSIIFQLYTLFADEKEKEEMREKFLAGGYGYGEAKKTLLKQIDDYFAPARSKRKELEKDKGYVEEILQKGAIKAREEASKTLKAARKACGID